MPVFNLSPFYSYGFQFVIIFVNLLENAKQFSVIIPLSKLFLEAYPPSETLRYCPEHLQLNVVLMFNFLRLIDLTKLRNIDLHLN